MQTKPYQKKFKINDFVNALRTAVQLNPAVKQKSSEIEANMFAETGAKAQLLPTLGGNYDVYRNNSNNRFGRQQRTQ